MLVVDGLTSNMLSTGIFDGGRGENSVFFNDFSLADILSFDMTDALIYMSFGIAGDELFSGKFTNFSSWTFGTDGSFSTEALASQFMNPSAVPLPAALPLFAFGLFGLWAGRARLLG